MIRYLKAYSQVNNQLNLNPEKLQNLVEKKLKAILENAYNNTLYYKIEMDKINYNPSLHFSGISDLTKLPVVNKKTLKENGFHSFISLEADLKDKFVDSTSGSSGLPIKVYRDKDERALQIAKWLRVLFINGYKITDKVMSFTPPIRLNLEKSPLSRLGLLRREAVNYLKSPEEMCNEVLRYKPQVLYGNRSQFDLVACELEKRNYDTKKLNLKFIVVTGEVVDEKRKEYYAKIYNTNVIETYGSVEMGVMAFETLKHDGLHLCEDQTYFEFLDEEGNPQLPGLPARVVVTDLSNKLMPFIRYEMGDRIIYKNIEENGFIFRRIVKIKGRDDDFVRTPDGKRLPVHHVADVLNKFQDIVQFRFIQKRIDKVELWLIADKKYLLKIHKDLLGNLKNKFPGICFEIIQVDQLPPDQTGKLRKVISEI